MKLSDIKNVMTFGAFHAEPDDSTAPWSKRFPKKRTLMLNVSRKHVTWRILDKNGVLGQPGSMEGELKEVLPQMAPEWRELTDGGWCSISLNHRFVVSLESNLPRRKALEDVLRTNPKAALGAKAERGRRYDLSHNSESNTSLLLACEEEVIVKLEGLCRDHGLAVGRLSVGAYAMLLHLTDQVRDSRRLQLARTPDTHTGTVLMAALCDGSLCALVQQEEQWTRLRSRTDLFTNDNLAPAVDLLIPMIEEAGPSTRILILQDIPRPDIADRLSAHHPGLVVSDITSPDQLAAIQADL